MQLEPVLLYLAVGLYLGAALLALLALGRQNLPYRALAALVMLALAVHAASIGLRWARLGHGPYVDLFEILSSNVWSLHLIVISVCAVLPGARSALSTILPVLTILTTWMLVTPSKDTVLPVTYHTIWLPVHMVLGKLFLGLTAVAVGLSLIVLIRNAGVRVGHAPPNDRIEPEAHRIMLVAVFFQSLMIVAGAAWARDAWGRYWSWDPLESWSFLTWLGMLGYLHWRSIRTDRFAVNSALVVGVFVLAFATFFGVPFLSTAPHKGAV